MNGLPFVYTPRPGESISISRDTDGRCAIVVTSGSRTSSVRILADEASGFAVMAARAIFEAAGKPEPVILERPGATFEGGVNRAGRVEVGRLNDRVTVGLYGIQPEEIEPAEALRLAALIAIRAAEIEEGEPDPAEIEELAKAIRSELYPPSESIGLRPGESDRTAARAALRWMKSRQQQGGCGD